jgi:hypothetical protein
MPKEAYSMVNPLELYQETKARIKIAEAMRHPDMLSYEAGVLSGEQRLRARQMRAAIYLKNGIISEEDLGPDGSIGPEKDPYDNHSIEFGVWDPRDPERILMSMRLILATEKEGYGSFQLHFDELPDEYQQRFADTDPESVAELAGYIKEPGLDRITSGVASLFLLREMVRASHKLGINEWVFGMKAPQLKRYKQLFGDAVESLGDQPVKFGNYAGDQYLPHSVDVDSAFWIFLASANRKIGGRAIARFWETAYDEVPTSPAPVSPAVPPLHHTQSRLLRVPRDLIPR